MELAFTKMHGLGNDFMVIDNTALTVELDIARIRRLASRKTGVGFDQLLIVEPASVPDAEFDYRIYNADGGEVEHCGNGARCFARFVTDRGLTSSRIIPVNTLNGMITLKLVDNGDVTVAMGVPKFSPAEIPFVAAAEKPSYLLQVGEQAMSVGVAAIGNPHVLVQVDDVEAADVAHLGPLIENHERFPQRVNVGFMQRIDATHARLRVFERGVGETLACGTGACAAVAIAHRQGLLERRVTVSLTGGELEIVWPDDAVSIEMTGPCSTVFEGLTKM
ncbi:MAG: diaminopimelate epimerase [Granulosicoccus sp.]